MQIEEFTRGDKHVCEIKSDTSLTGALIIMTAKYDLADADEDAVFQIRSDGGSPAIVLQDEFTAIATIPASATNGITKPTRLWADVQAILSGAPVTIVPVIALEIALDVTRITT